MDRGPRCGNFGRLGDLALKNPTFPYFGVGQSSHGNEISRSLARVFLDSSSMELFNRLPEAEKAKGNSTWAQYFLQRSRHEEVA